jgi:hypothetical protein
MGAAHQVNATYFTPGAGLTAFPEAAGHPDDKWGWVVGAGIKLNAPMIGQGDFFQAQVNYTEGALKYIFQTPNTNWSKQDGNTVASGLLSDAVYGGLGPATGTDLELTTAWGVNAAYEHFWNPRWRTSLYGGYAQVSYNSAATGQLCAGAPTATFPGCDFDWSTWWVGSRTQWNVTKDFYMGVDVLYSKLQTSTNFGLVGGTVLAIGTTAPVLRPADDVDNWMFRFRVHRDFYP